MFTTPAIPCLKAHSRWHESPQGFCPFQDSSEHAIHKLGSLLSSNWWQRQQEQRLQKVSPGLITALQAELSHICWNLLSTTSVGAIGVEVRRRDGCSPFRCRRRGLGVMGCCRLEVCTFLEELESLGQIMFNKWSISFALETPGYPLLTPLSEHSRSINSLHVQP